MSALVSATSVSCHRTDSSSQNESKTHIFVFAVALKINKTNKYNYAKENKWLAKLFNLNLFY